MHAAELPRQQALVVRALAVAALAALVALLLAASPAGARTTAAASSTSKPIDPNALVTPPSLTKPPPGRRLTVRHVRRIADRLPAVVKERKRHRGSYASVFEKGSDRWQVSYYAPGRPLKEVAQVTIWDVDGRVMEAYTGYKVPWTMARGYPGAFGRKINSPWVWIPLTLLFLAPFLDPRRPFRLLHLDVLVLAAFGISVAFFNDAQIDRSVPLVFPLLAYLLVRMLWIGLRTRPERDPAAAGRRLPVTVPVTWLAVALLFLVGFRVGLNVTNSNVIDVGYAGVIGAERLADSKPLYGAWPKDNEHGDTYGPVTYAAYVPFEQLLPWSGKWDDVPAAHAAAIAFDLLTILLCFLVGRRVRGPDLGVVLAYAWAAWPFSVYAMNCNANDALVAVFLLLALYVAASPVKRGAAAALGGLTKFATLGVAPLLALDGTRSRRALLGFSAAFAGVAVLAFLPVVAQGQSLHDVYDRTIGYQAGRSAPFSIWGLYGWTAGQHVWEVFAVLLAVGIALVPRRRDVIGLAACVAAVVIALQMGLTYWFYLYLVWFFPLVMLALLGRYDASPRR